MGQWVLISEGPYYTMSPAKTGADPSFKRHMPGPSSALDKSASFPLGKADCDLAVVVLA
jgi:hypothetical protein